MLDDECILVADDAESESEDPAEIAEREGFPYEGLDIPAVQECVKWAEKLELPVTDELLRESYAYYWEYDAFLPYPGAPEPPPADVILEKQDREFIESLGPERPGTRCAVPGCFFGTVAYSAFCKVHHFENVIGRPVSFGLGR